MSGFRHRSGHFAANFQRRPTVEDGMRILTIGALLAASLGLAACGHDPGTRAVTGGLIGAGAGAAVGAATGGSPATGALVGGGVGAVGGAVTR
jgi:osmotically inducible lipoprotein OsmB